MSSLFLHAFFVFCFFSFLSEINQVGQRTIDFPFFENILHILFKQHLDKGSKPHYTCDRGFITLVNQDISSVRSLLNK